MEVFLKRKAPQSRVHRPHTIIRLKCECLPVLLFLTSIPGKMTSASGEITYYNFLLLGNN